MNAQELIEKIDWQKVDGLVPVVVQDSMTSAVLMHAYMNTEALQKTFTDEKVTFYSRTKQRLWQKGETSRNYLELVSVSLDCDSDTLLVKAKPHGPTCHKGTQTCFGDDLTPNANFLLALEDVIRARKNTPSAESYTSQLFSKGINKIAQKVGEEGVETVIAGLNESNKHLIGESADLLYHLLVLLAEREIDLSQVIAELQERHR